MIFDSQINTYDDSQLRDDQFALVVLDKAASLKMFPTDSCLSTQKSCVEFNNYKQDLGDNEQKIAAHFLKEACKTWGLEVPPVVEDNAAVSADYNFCSSEVPSSLNKMASAPVEYNYFALRGHYAIDSPELLKKAGEYFEENWDKFNQMDRRSYASAVRARADDLSVETNSAIEKFASAQYDSGLTQQLKLRRYFAEGEQNKKAYEKIDNYRTQLSVDEFYPLLHELDKKANLTRLYGKKRLLDPLTAVAGTPFNKQASWTVEVNGKSYGPEDLKSALKNPQVEKMFGKDFCNQLKKHPEVFTSLPLPEKEDILGYASK